MVKYGTRQKHVKHVKKTIMQAEVCERHLSHTYTYTLTHIHTYVRTHKLNTFYEHTHTHYTHTAFRSI